MIELSRVSIKLPSRVLANDISLRRRGQSLLIEGGIGTGKSLLARAIAGVGPQPDITISGEVTLGKDRISLTAARPRQVRIGYIPQITSYSFLAPSLLAEVEAAAFCSASNAREASLRISRWRSESPLARFSSRTVQSLSGGQQRLFAIELLMLSEPDHIIMDSGNDALDARFAKRTTELLKSWLDADSSRCIIRFVNSGMSQDVFGRSKADIRLGDAGPLLSLIGKRGVRVNTSQKAPVVEVYGLSFGYPKTKYSLFDSVSFVIREGEFVGLRGKNGVGKSTLLRLIIGLIKAPIGEVKIFGRDVQVCDWPGLTGGALLIPQEPELAGVGQLAERVGGAERIIAGISIWDGRGETYWQLSSGERALAALAEQARHGPRIWILDEPSSRIPVDILARTMWDARERNADLSALIVSHDEEFIDALCDRKLLLEENGILEF